MPSLGADPEHLRAQADQLGSAGARLDELFTAVAGVVAGATWSGPDADAFRTEFDQARIQAMITANRVRARGRLLVAEADQQAAASHPVAGGPDGIPAVSIFAGARASADVSSESLLATMLKVFDKGTAARIPDVLKDRLPLSPAALRALKLLPAFGTIPDALQLGDALADGDTGGTIGNFYEIALGAIPHPVAGGASLLNSALGDVLPGNKTPLERSGDLAAQDIRVRTAEALGIVVSERIGFDAGSTESNMISSGAGLGAHILLQVLR